jgi:hypothetical protein
MEDAETHTEETRTLKEGNIVDIDGGHAGPRKTPTGELAMDIDGGHADPLKNPTGKLAREHGKRRGKTHNRQAKEARKQTEPRWTTMAAMPTPGRPPRGSPPWT